MPVEVRGQGLEGIAVLHIGRDQRGVNGEIGRQRAQRLVIVPVGRDHPHAERIALRVDHRHPLAALDLTWGSGVK